MATINFELCDEIYDRWCKKGVPTLRQIKMLFWVEMRNRALQELEEMKADGEKDREKTTSLRDLVRELAHVFDVRDEKNLIPIEYCKRIKTERERQRSEAAAEQAQSIGATLFREWKADLSTLALAVQSGHIKAKKYRQFFYRYRMAIDHLVEHV